MLSTFIYPKPLHLTEKEGYFKFGDNINCLFSSKIKEADFVNILSELWCNFTGGNGKINFYKSDKIGENSFCMGTEKTIDLKSGYSYVLNIDSESVCIKGATEKDAIRGFLTLLQCISVDKQCSGNNKFLLPQLEITDKPAMEFRGIHLCVFPETSLNRLHKFIRFIALLKYSHIVLEFWGMLKLEAMKELAWPQAYTKEQIKPIIREANALGVEIIPMFNHLGHGSQSRSKYGKHVVLDQNPAMQRLYEDDDWSWCITSEETKNILKMARQELIELCGEGQFFHIGCDESDSFGTCPLCKSSGKKRHELFAEYLAEINTDLMACRRRPIIWGDQLLERSKFAGEYCANSNNEVESHKVLEDLSKNFVIADWQYDVFSGDILTSECFLHKKFDTLLSPWYDLENIEALSNYAIRKNAFGILATTWHTLPDKIQAITYTAQCCWNGAADMNSENTRLAICGRLARKAMQAENYAESGFRNEDVSV